MKPREFSGVVLAVPLVLFVLGAAAAPPPTPEEAARLRNLGLAQLENERPAEAADTFRKLTQLVPGDPLSYANLAIAALRQQKSDEARGWIARALERAPGRADLLALQGDVLQWSGKDEEALAAYRKAAAAAPEQVDVQYSLYRQASRLDGPEAAAALAEALKALSRLRPENLVVLLQAGQRAVSAGDRPGATQAFLRVRELAGTASPAATAALGTLLTVLESGDVAAARVPTLRLENVLKPTIPYQQSLQELSPGVLGVPVERFVAEPPSSIFGEPLAVRFRAERLAEGQVLGRALAVGDFDGDDKPDLAWVQGGETPRLELRRGAGGDPVPGPDATGIAGLLAVDLDNDGRLDLIGFGPQRLAFWRGKEEGGGFEDASAGAGLTKAGGEAAAAFDFDIEGDLDLAISGTGEEIRLFRNALPGPLEDVGPQTLPRLALSGVKELVASDLDRDGDLDLVVAHARGIAWLDNQRQGRFVDRTAAAGLTSKGAVEALASADLDDDGRPELVAAGDGITLLHNLGGRFAPWPLPGLPQGQRFDALVAFDADNDGRLDLAAAGPDGVVILAARGTLASPAFAPLPVEGALARVSALAAADLDADGDLDLAAAGAAGLHRLIDEGGNKNHWLDVRLRALTQGSGKNNVQGLGSVVEVRSGSAYQFREVAGSVTHLGLGRLRQPDLLRVIWTNGVPQTRLQPLGDQRIVEEQLLKGSCPFLYAWNGERFTFVSDLLWNSPIGLPVAPGVWAGADPDELVRVDGVREAGGVYRLRVTEELWEAAFFDAMRLWVVDHPEDVEVASSLKVEPGRRQPVEVLASRDLRPVTAAWDGGGAEVTDRVRARDETYASGFEPSPYQGVAKPWTFTFDLGEAPAGPVRLHLDGWIFPADASLNLASAQRPDLPYLPPRLEVETDQGWQILMPSMGFPAGKTKTMVVETPPLPAGARRLRIVTSLWLAWDRIVWTRQPADAEPVVRARLAPAVADLRYRGFSSMLRVSPNGPHSFDYNIVQKETPWLPFPGRYTRYGDVRELLKTADDRSVILAPGDEIALEFDASALPRLAAGWTRTVFLQSQGWDKDADRNTYEALQMEPLPFRGMKRYGEAFPDTPELREYVERWLTRRLP